MHSGNSEQPPRRPGRIAGAVLAFLAALVLLVWLRSDGGEKPAGQGALPENGSVSCVTRYRPGEVLFSQAAAQRLLQSPQELAAYIKSVSGRRHWGLQDNLTIRPSDRKDKSPVLAFALPKGSINPGNREAPRGGAGFYWMPELPEGVSSACLSYGVWFPPDFDFVKGGKLPGLFGGDGPSGGRKVTGENGFSMRFMWRAQGAGEVYAYIVGNHGRGISLERGAFSFPRGQWLELAQEVILNRPGREDGVVRVWANGRLVIERTGLVYRKVPDMTIKGVMAHVFFGGKKPSWAARADSLVRLTPFELRWRKLEQ